MKLQCMIVDDEPHAIKVLESYLKRVDHLEIAASCQNAITAFDLLRKKKIDLLFLDIKMPVITGVDFLRSLLNPPKIIFTTAYREYAVDGFDLDAVDYLLKPISFDRFLRAIAKVNRQFPSDLEAGLIENVEHSTIGKESFLYLRIEKSMKKIVVKDILYIESAKDYAKLFLTNGKSLVVKQSISVLEDMLSADSFIRIHRSFIAAINKINSFGPTQVMAGEVPLPIGRLYKRKVLSLLKGEEDL